LEVKGSTLKDRKSTEIFKIITREAADKEQRSPKRHQAMVTKRRKQ
jgi:hypothetical protein